MIYINADSEFIIIPKYIETTQTSFILTLVNNYSKNEVSIDVSDKLTLNEFFYKIILDKDDIKDFKVGEYIYSLINDSDVLSSGLLVFGEYNNKYSEYKKDKTNDIIYGE